MTLTLDELKKELAKGQLRPAYLLVGSESLLRDDATAVLRASILEPGSEDFNLDRLVGNETTPAALEDVVGTLPVMAARRLVILTEPEPRRGSSRVLVDALAALVPDLCDQEQTVLVVVAESVDRRSRWFKAFRDPAAVVSCAEPKGQREIVKFVKAEAERQGIPLASGTAEALAEQVGGQLLVLRQELAKVALLAGEGETVERTHVAQSTRSVADQPIWDLTDAIGDGRVADAVTLLARMLATGAAPPAVLGALASHFRKLTRIAHGQTPGGPPFAVRKLNAQCRRYSPDRLVTCMANIAQTDTALKGAGALPGSLALERLVIWLAS